MANNKIKVGDKAPQFKLPDATGEKIALADLEGKWVVLYFYPKDNTPGCTVEAIEFTALIKEFANLNAEIFGVSKDSCKSHEEFIRGQKLKVRLLADEDSAMQKAYGVWRQKKFMGREFLGTVRSTVLVDPQGTISYIWDPVQAKGHAAEVLTELKKQAENS